MVHWESTRDGRYWLRYIECGHWGLVLTHVLPRLITPRDWEAGIACVRVP